MRKEIVLMFVILILMVLLAYLPTHLKKYQASGAPADLLPEAVSKRLPSKEDLSGRLLVPTIPAPAPGEDDTLNAAAATVMQSITGVQSGIAPQGHAFQPYYPAGSAASQAAGRGSGNCRPVGAKCSGQERCCKGVCSGGYCIVKLKPSRSPRPF